MSSTLEAASAGALETMYIVVIDEERGISSYTWRVWWHGTSFYIKARNAALADFKVSLHGPDSFHRKRGFIVGRDRSAKTTSDIIDRGRFLGSRFSGRDMGNGTLHVATFRFGSELFEEGMPGVPVAPVKIRTSTSARYAPAPSAGMVTDVHLYLSKDRPYVPHQKKAEEANAIFGPLVNTQGEYLTGLGNGCSLARNPTPSDLIGPAPEDDSDRVRGVGVSIDPSGFLWIREQWLSRKAKR